MIDLKSLYRPAIETKCTGNYVDGATWHFWMDGSMERD